VIATPDALDVADNVPHVLSPQLAPKSTQVTPLFCASFWTVAVKLWLPLVGTLADKGDTLTAMAPGAAVTVIVVSADFVLSVTEVAVSVTVAGDGTLAGAVYVMGAPEALDAAETVPHAAPLHPPPERLHVTPLFCESFWTVAVKF
jgi:hypothetical protein